MGKTDFKQTITFNPIYLTENLGHGNARRVSLENCRNSLVALMDADDISLPYRFQVQLQAFTSNEYLDVLGGQIIEFSSEIGEAIGKRKVPIKHEQIVNYVKRRCPMNQQTVMFKKNSVECSGGYLDWFCNEDYYLWIRMLENNCIFANLSETLVNVRAGEEMSVRRGGWRYFLSEAKLQKYMLRRKMISIPRYLYNTAIRFGGEVILTNRLRTSAYKLLRAKADEESLSLGSDKGNTSVIEDVLDSENELTKYPPFSVAICVYGKDNPEWFDRALESVIINQTVKPNEIVLVVDGPVPEGIQKVIEKYTKICSGGGAIRFIVINFKQNKGLGEALKVAVEQATNELIARMDSDDISYPDRFEQQLKLFANDNRVDVVGGDITEFIDTESNVVGKRVVPNTDTEIKIYLKRRCPLNHVSVMYKKGVVLAAGGYQDWFWNEDYYLWIRMLLRGAVFTNTGTNLVNVRVGKDMYARRGGYRYFKSEIGIQKLMLQEGIINREIYIENCIKRFIVQCMLPTSVRAWVFKKFARK